MAGETPSASMSEDEARAQFAEYLETGIDVDKDGIIISSRNMTTREFAAAVRAKEPWTQQYVQGWIRQEAELAMNQRRNPETPWQRVIRIARFLLGKATIDGRGYEN